MQALCRRKNKMITLEDVRNAKLADLFCATIVKELTWEEAERYPLSVEGLPEGVTASDVLQYAVKSTLEERGEMSEKALEDMTKEIKEEILSGLQESQNTIVLKKGTEYFDMADMQMLDTTKYKLERVVPLSQYATEEDFSVENDEKNGLEFCIDEKVFERYLNEIEQ